MEVTKYKASDVVLVKDGRLSNDVEVYLASDTDQRDAVRLAEIARLREALLSMFRVILNGECKDDVRTVARSILDAALSSSPQNPVTATEVTRRLEEKRGAIKDMLHVESSHLSFPHVIIYDEAPGITVDDLNKIPEPKPTSPQSDGNACIWTQEYEESGLWTCGACGLEWYFEEDGPECNEVSFCPKCGRAIEGFKRPDADDDDLPEPPEVK